MTMESQVGLDAHIPSGPIDKKWDLHKFESKLINPSNRRKFDIIIVGSGLAPPQPPRLASWATR